MSSPFSINPPDPSCQPFPMTSSELRRSARIGKGSVGMELSLFPPRHLTRYQRLLMSGLHQDRCEGSSSRVSSLTTLYRPVLRVATITREVSIACLDRLEEISGSSQSSLKSQALDFPSGVTDPGMRPLFKGRSTHSKFGDVYAHRLCRLTRSLPALRHWRCQTISNGVESCYVGHVQEQLGCIRFIDKAVRPAPCLRGHLSCSFDTLMQ